MKNFDSYYPSESSDNLKTEWDDLRDPEVEAALIELELDNDLKAAIREILRDQDQDQSRKPDYPTSDHSDMRSYEPKALDIPDDLEGINVNDILYPENQPSQDQTNFYQEPQPPLSEEELATKRKATDQNIANIIQELDNAIRMLEES